MEWYKTSEKLPEEIKTAFDEDGDIDIEKPYLGVFISFEDYDGEDDETEPSEMDIVFYYGNNSWKNNRWEKVYVKYWLEIPPLD